MSDERKSSLGEFLKSEREKRGLTIEQTASATKIGLKVLRQLEADQYADLPALPFVRGFVRNYGKFLSLDGDKLLTEYASFLEEHSRERPKRDAGHSGYAFERPEGEQSRKILWGVMAGMLFFGGVVVFVFKPSLKHKHHGHVDKLKAGSGQGDESMEGVVIPSPSGIPSGTPSGAPSPLVSPLPIVSATPSVSPTVGATVSAVVYATATPEVSPSHTPVFVPPKVPLVLAPPEDVKPSKTSAPEATPIPSRLPTPSPVSSASSVPADVKPTEANAIEADLLADKLQSGANYPVKEVKYRLIFRTKADAWVRYRCDEKQLMKFRLKMGKILVLRGKTSVWFQTSNAKAVTVAQGSGAGRILSSSANAFEYNNNPTAVWPLEARGMIEEKFKPGRALPLTEDPVDPELTLPAGPSGTE